MTLRIVLIWICFVASGAFYCSVLPLWEGFDEWAYFGVVDHMVATGDIVVDRDIVVSEEINASLDLAPLPRGMTSIPAAGVTREVYWKLDPDERARRQEALAGLTTALNHTPPRTGGMPAYESFQAPLYFWILAPLLKPVANASLLTRVWWARMLTFLIGSLIIPFGYTFFRKVWNDTRLALAATTMLAALPGLALDMARVSNEGINIVMFTLLALFLVQATSRPESRKSAAMVGLTLGFGLLTKATFLIALPASLIAYAIAIFLHGSQWKVNYGRVRLYASRMSLIFGIAVIIAGWWYIRSYLQTNTLTGLEESRMLLGVSFEDKLYGIFRLNWISAIGALLLSHIWFGGWSLLALPHWPYILCFALILIASVGVLWKLRSNALHQKSLVILLSLYVVFWLGQAYQMVMMLLSRRSSTSMGGWYLYCMIALEVVFMYSGLAALVPSARRWVLPLLTLAAGLLDVLAVVFVALPYYGHISQYADILRLTIDKPYFLTPAVLICLCGLFALRFVLLQCISIQTSSDGTDSVMLT